MQKIKIELKWAVIFSLAVLTWMVLEKLSGLHDKYLDYQYYLTNLFAIPAIIIMVMALKDKKKNFYSGKMSYKQGLTTGIILSVFIALLSPITQWVTTYWITPDYFTNVIKRTVELGWYKSTQEAEAVFNFSSYVKQGLIGSLVMGILTTTIAMIFIRTKGTEGQSA